MVKEVGIHLKTREILFALCLIAGLGLGRKADASTGIRALDSAAILVKAPDKVVLIAITTAGSRLVAVGEHGVITYSDDGGKTWKQSSVPVDVTLTAIRFINENEGWAAGHYGVILHTIDGGATWRIQLDGIQANQLTLAAAQTALVNHDPSPGTPLAMKRAAFFVAAGPDKPFLTILANGQNNVTVFGAYRMAMRSIDDGRHWVDWSLHVGDPKSHNLYDVAPIGPDIYIAGETGLVFRSVDNGYSYQPVTAPTDATLFSVLPAGDGGVLVAGVAGQAFLSEDHGTTWQTVGLGTDSNLTSGIVLKSGAILLASEAGNLYISWNHGKSFTLMPEVEPMSLYDLVQASDGDIVVVGDAGVAILKANAFLRSTSGA